ncbi:helix-turn-helix transcriptional regulator [uncultured Mucilaginibacter sp.]|uniref:helix-turn-helix domain-containing protein n=1 Tax=uncultured Mucilaginibacter sp. TaxID=797541 RepID=UPI0025DBAADE|nr:helix-turn-helix transcriptional regulator [uncultured Mucilaginibacter sp.]
MNNVRNDEIIKAFGNKVRFLRKEKKYTMEKLAELAGIDYRQLSYIEHGRFNVTISTIAALADALQLTLSELLQLDGY